MIVELLTLVALTQAPAESGVRVAKKDKPASTLTQEEQRLIDDLVKQVVSQTRPAKEPRAKAKTTTRPASARRAKGRTRIRVTGGSPSTTRPTAAASEKKPKASKRKAPSPKTARRAKRRAAAPQEAIPTKTEADKQEPKTKTAAAMRSPKTQPRRAERARAGRRGRIERAPEPPARAVPDRLRRPEPRSVDELTRRMREAATRDEGRRLFRAGRIKRTPTTQRALDMMDDLPELSQLRGRIEIVPTSPETIAIQGDEEAVAALEGIIRLLDATEAPLKLEVIQLRNAQATQLASTLSSLLSQLFRRPGRRARPSDQVVVLADARSNSLLIGAAEERMPQVREIVEKLDSEPLIGPVSFKTFPLEHMRATEASELLGEMIERLQSQRGVRGDPITIIPDERTNTLIVTAPEADLKSVGDMIKLIDVEPIFATAKMIHIPLMNAEAEALEDMLTEMVSQQMSSRRGRAITEQLRRLQLRTSKGKELPELDLEKPIKITADPGTNSLLIGSTEQNLRAMEEIVTLFDSVPVSEEVLVRVFPLKDADASDLSQMIQQVFQEGKQLSAGPGGRSRGRTPAVPEGIPGSALMYNIGLAADTRTNTLIASGREEQIALVQEMVGQLDRPGMAMKWPVRMHKVENASAQALAQMIQRLMDQRLQALERLGPTARERERVTVIADVRSNALVILAKDENFEEIVELATKLDTREDIAGDIRMITLEKTEANVIQPKIEQLWRRRMQLLQQAGGVRDEPVIVTDARSNSLIVASSKEDFEAIKELVKTLEDAPLTPIADIRIIKLEHNAASVLAPTLQRLFEERMQMRQTPGARPLPSDQVAIFPDPVVNALLVACNQENYDVLTELLKKLDVELPLEGVVQFFVLEHADATRVAEVIEGMFRTGLYKPGNLGQETEITRARDKIVIEPDMRTNSLIVSASKENYSIIEKLIKQMDVKEAPFLEGNVRIFKLKHGDAVKLGSMLEEVLQKMQTFRQRVGPELPVTVLADDVSNTLVVSGSRDVLGQAESLLAQLDVPTTEPARDIRPYSLVHASAAKAAEILQDLFQERRQRGRQTAQGTPPFIRADDTANVLIVAASQADQQIVEGLLEHIDVKSEAAKRMKIFPLERAQAEDLQEVVEELYSQQRSTGTGGRGAGPGISLSVDPQTNSLIVWAAPSEMEDISDLVEKLDTTNPRDETRLRIFRLKQADAEELAENLEEILSSRGGTTRGGGAGDSVIISYAARKDQESGEEVIHKLVRRNVQIVPDKLTNSLLVRATPDSLTMLEELIETIDGIPPREVDVQVFHLVNADAEQMVEVLEKLFKVDEQQRRGRGRADEETRLTMTGVAGMAGMAGEGGPPGRQLLSFTPDTRTNSVIAAGTEEYLKLAEKLIRELDEQEIEDRTNLVYQVKFSKAEDMEAALKSHFDNISKLYRELGDEEAKLRQIEREVSVVADTKTESLLISASPRYESQVMKMVNELDRPPPQVMVQVLIAEVTLDDRVELGLEFAVQDLLFSETAYVGNNNMIKGPDNNFDFVAGTDLGAAGSTLGGFSFTITGEDFNFLLRALQSEGKLEVLSRPAIMAEDNQKASISIGQEVPFVRGVSILSDGRTQTNIDYEKVGIILDVTPFINPDGYVSLDVAPEISGITDSSVQVTEGIFAPIFNKRTAETTVTVKDGETIVIGGLITSEDENRETKVPILGDIPGLGNLFRATVTSKTKTELLIVLTPVVVRNEREARSMSEEVLSDGVRSDPLLQSPLMKGLRMKPENMPLAPTEDEPPTEDQLAPPANSGAEARPIRMEYGPSRPNYGPGKPKLTDHVEPKRMVGPDSFEQFLGPTR